MDIREFAQEFIDNVKMSVEMTGNDYDQELATSILEYIEDNGEVNAPEICTFQKTRARITAPTRSLAKSTTVRWNKDSII